MKKTISAITLTILLFSCQENAYHDQSFEAIPDKKLKQVHVAWVGKDSIRGANYVWLLIEPKPKKDSVHKVWYVGADTTVGFFAQIPVMDSTGKKQLIDSLGRPKFTSREVDLPNKRDSIFYHTDGLDLDSLVKIKGKF